jgi:predicted RNA-binding Zn ribbon-like protein
MSISKRGLLATAAAAGLSAGAVARAQTPSMSKSTRITRIDEGEAIRVYPQTGGVHKSNTRVSAEKHLAALRKGAREITKNTVIYKQGGKMYMYDYQDEANTEAAENFQSQFDNE